MIVIDGSKGEGGGQMVRSSLTMSLLTGQPVRIDNVRAGRRRPGLLRQHLTALTAAAEIGEAQVGGAYLGSTRVTFSPRAVRGGDYRYAIGSAGSAGLVLQTVLPPLLRADGPSTVRVEGGTHNAWAPPWDFLEACWLPVMKRMGADITLRLVRHGFYPAGGGAIVAEVTPGPLTPLELVERGDAGEHRATALFANLSGKIAKRQLSTLATHGIGGRMHQVDANGPGNVVFATLRFEHVTEVVTGFGKKGVPAEKIADDVAGDVGRYLSHDAPVGEHLADQLMIPLWLAGAGCYRTGPVSQHAHTNLDVMRAFGSGVPRVETQGETSRIVL